MISLSAADRKRLDTILKKYQKPQNSHRCHANNPVEDWVSLGEREFLKGVGQHTTADGRTLYYTKMPPPQPKPAPRHWWDEDIPYWLR